MKRDAVFEDGHEHAIRKVASASAVGRTLHVTVKDVSALSRRSPNYGSKATPRAEEQLVQREAYERDRLGRVIEERQERPNGQWVVTTRFAYDDAGRLATRTRPRDNGSEYDAFTFEYDSTGRLYQVLSKGHVVELYSEYKVDGHGNWIQRTVDLPNFRLAGAPGAERPSMKYLVEWREISYLAT